MISLFKRIINNLRVIGKPLTVHAEAIVLDNVWEEVKKLALSRKIKTWYVVTPANYNYLKEFLNIKMNKKKFSSTLEERYKWMLNHSQKLELHVHLNIIMNITKVKQEKLIKESIEWANNKLGIRFSEFVPGWWTDNFETREILRKYNLKRIKRTDFKSMHDYDLIRNKKEIFTN